MAGTSSGAARKDKRGSRARGLVVEHRLHGARRVRHEQHLEPPRHGVPQCDLGIAGLHGDRHAGRRRQRERALGRGDELEVRAQGRMAAQGLAVGGGPPKKDSRLNQAPRSSSPEALGAWDQLATAKGATGAGCCRSAVRCAPIDGADPRLLGATARSASGRLRWRRGSCARGRGCVTLRGSARTCCRRRRDTIDTIRTGFVIRNLDGSGMTDNEEVDAVDGAQADR